MANNCENCERVLAKHVGMALLRPACMHSTMYEHFGDYKNFKKSREEDEIVRKHKEELLKFSSTFTNFNLKRVLSKGDFNQFSTRDIVRFRRQLRMGNKDRLLSKLLPSPKSSKISRPQNTCEAPQSQQNYSEASKSQKKIAETYRPQRTLPEPPKRQIALSEVSKPQKTLPEPPRSQKPLAEVPQTQRKLHETPKSKNTMPDIVKPQVIQDKTASNSQMSRHSFPAVSDRLVVRTPVNCAITCCNQIVGVTAVFTHYVRDHSDDYGIQCQEIQPNKRAILVFDPTNLDWAESVCLGVLAYGAKERKYCPAERGLCAHNAFLPSPFENMDAHLAVLIMANRNSWTNCLCNEEDGSKSEESDEAQQMIVLWFSSVKVTRPLHCTITVFNKCMTICRSNVVRIRNLYESQNPGEFLSMDANCLRLGYSDVKMFSQNFTESIYLEMYINEFEEKALWKR